MDFLPIKTRKFIPPQDKDNLFELLDQYLPKLKDKDVVVVTSKIVSIHQGRFIKITSKTDRLQLIKQEAEAYFTNHPSSMTIKEHTLTPYAGIDRSNGHGHYILFPQNPQEMAKSIWAYLRRRDQINRLGVIIADSTCHPLRWGHFGISLGFFGFKPVYWYKKQKDIFGRKLIHHCQNIVDALTALAVIYLGEGNEQTPILIIRNFPKIRFSKKPHTAEFFVGVKDDLYSPLLQILQPAQKL